jgi:hypothetical protein
MVWPTAGVAGQGRERILVLNDDFNSPVKIKAVKAKGRLIKTDKKFSADDDWFEGLTAIVVNNTGKEILSISIDVWLLRPEEQAQEPGYVHNLEYNIDPLWFKPGEEYQTDKPPVPTGSAVEITLSTDAYYRIKFTLSELGYPSSHQSIKIRISSVGFSDGTVWRSGDYYRRDPTAPTGWRKIEAPQGSARNGTADFFASRLATPEIGETVQVLEAT